MSVNGIKRWWANPWTRRVLTLLIVAVVVALLWKNVRAIEWSEVLKSVRGYEKGTLALAVALSALSYLIYSCFDVLGKYYLRLKVSVTQCMSTAFIAYAINQSLGAMIGTVALRLRLYSRLGLGGVQISKLIAFSVITNWLGYAALTGALFVAGIPQLPEGWGVGQGALRWFGVVAVAVTIGYLLACHYRQRDFHIFKRKVEVPSARIALMQVGCSIGHWPATAMIIYVLLNGRVDFATVLGALLLSATATVLTRVPAGLGVLEAVFVSLLRHRIPVNDILAALLVFRAVFNLLPLSVASAMYLKKEIVVGRFNRLKTTSN